MLKNGTPMTQIKRISTDSIRDFLLNPPYPRSIISLTLKTILSSINFCAMSCWAFLLFKFSVLVKRFKPMSMFRVLEV